MSKLLELSQHLQSFVRVIENFPKKGCIFKDLTALMSDSRGFKLTINELVYCLKKYPIDKIIGIDARGFIIGSALAYSLGVGFVPVRKQGKLPGNTISEEYHLEYGIDKLCIHTTDITVNSNVIIIDDILATGGTISAVIKLIQRLKAKIQAIGVVMEIIKLKGREKLKDFPVYSLIKD